MNRHNPECSLPVLGVGGGFDYGEGQGRTLVGGYVSSGDGYGDDYGTDHEIGYMYRGDFNQCDDGSDGGDGLDNGDWYSRGMSLSMFPFGLIDDVDGWICWDAEQRLGG